MPSQIGYFDKLKSAAGKVFTYLASITLTGVDGKTLTINKNITLTGADDTSEATLPAGAHPIAPLDSPAFTGIVSKNSLVQEFVVTDATIVDNTIAIVLTFVTVGFYVGHLVEILVAMARDGNSTPFSSIVRYAITSKGVGDAAIVTDMTHDLVAGTTEAVSVSNNVVTVTLTAPQVIERSTTWVRCVGSANILTSVTVS